VVEVDGRLGKRSFSVHKFGEKEARAMAIEARRENLARVLKERQQLLLTNVVAVGRLPAGAVVREPPRVRLV
jgi:AP2 domain